MPQSVSQHHPTAVIALPARQLADRAAFLRVRQTGVTATDQRVLAGYGYKDESVFSHWQDKFLPITDQPESAVPMRWRLGSDLESAIAKYAAEALGVKMAKVGVLRHRQFPHLISSPDRNCSDGTHCELKATDKWYLRAHEDDDGPQNDRGYVLPMAWWNQGGHQALVSGRRRIHFAALLGRDDLTTWTVDYTDADLRLAKVRADLFWDHVQSATPPPIDFDTVTAREMALRYPKVGEPGMRVLSDDEANEVRLLIEARQRAKGYAKSAKADLDDVENRLKAIIGDAEQLWARDGKKWLVKYPVVESGKWDVQELLFLLDAAHIPHAAAFHKTTHRSFTSVPKI